MPLGQDVPQSALEPEETTEHCAQEVPDASDIKHITNESLNNFQCPEEGLLMVCAF